MADFSQTGRRTVLRGGAALGAGIIAGCLDFTTLESDDTESSAANASDENGSNDVDTEDDAEEWSEWSENGALTFIYDDGPVQDLELALPAHEKYDAPASVGIVSDWIESDDERWMDFDDVETLSDAGWEIASHTATHVAISSFELVADVSSGDSRIYPEGRGQHGFMLGNPIEVTDGEKLVQRTVIDSGTDDVGKYIELDRPINDSFIAGETVERYPETFVREELEESKQVLSEFQPTTFLAPHDVIDDYHLDIVREYYDGVFNVNPDTLINDVPFDSFDTNRSYFAERVDRDSVYEDLEQIAEAGLYGMVGAHTHFEEVTQDRIEETLEWCDELSIDVITFEDAISRASAE
ncbi:hypothetical protein C477_05219 [Haloterrigena salina JCM 13891]|uniref:NodB homology domain-containing protein n=1 Tax=Haloterrigena salina JCM 13891 TaxID=1227488 RepID=M0CEM6_9EURY|nr:polysaccharide deacetylase family protein [Haloterrigena salina]ELZ21716.1 hypothetical protein C477_05219 [Haloterrigena salina JCM 13891]